MTTRRLRGCAASNGLRGWRDRRLRGDDGIAVVFVAIAMIALLSVAAVAVDAGTAYGQRRQMQNASDAAAMAGTRVIERWLYADDTSFTKQDIRTAVLDVLEEYGAEGGRCWLVINDARQTAVSGDFCTNPGALSAINPLTDRFNGVNANGQPLVNLRVAGVRVEAKDERATSLAWVMGADEVTARADATAVVQPFAYEGDTPFIVCGADGVFGNPIGEGYDILDASGEIKPAAIGTRDASGRIYDIQGAQVPACNGNSSAFKGKGGHVGEFPGWVAIVPGNGQVPDAVRAKVLDQYLTPCPGNWQQSWSNCVTLIPLAVASRGTGGNTELYVMKWTAWKILDCQGQCGSGYGHHKFRGELLGDASNLVAQGQGGLGSADSGARVMKLVE